MSESFWNIASRVKLKAQDALSGAVTLESKHEPATNELVYFVTRFGDVFARDCFEVRIASPLVFKLPVDKLVEKVVVGLSGVMQKDAELQAEKNRWIADILAAPHEWDRFYIFADWLDDQGLELEAEQWRWRGQFFGQWSCSGSAIFRLIEEELKASVEDTKHWAFFVARDVYEHDESWCKKHNLRYVPKWPVTLEDVRKGRDGQ